MKPAAFAIALGLASSLAFAQEPPKKKLIEFGWDEPDTTFLRKHVATMERAAPLDGCVFHAAWKAPGAGGKSGNFTWECWSARAFTEGELSQALADLKGTPAKTMRHNFLRF